MVGWFVEEEEDIYKKRKEKKRKKEKKTELRIKKKKEISFGWFCIMFFLRPTVIRLQVRITRFAFFLSETTNESTTSFILFLVNIEDDLSSSSRVARSVLFVRSGCEHSVVTRCGGSNVPPSGIARSNSDGALETSAFNTGNLCLSCSLRE